MTKLTAEIIERSFGFQNAIQDRELDLRGTPYPFVYSRVIHWMHGRQQDCSHREPWRDPGEFHL